MGETKHLRARCEQIETAALDVGKDKGNAPGNRSHNTRLAEGQIHLWSGLPRVNMAFGQTSRCAPIPGAVPQATVK
jgi:hypothetical protein